MDSPEKNKTGIITFHCARNFGAVLQCYALQETVKALGANVEVVDYRPESLLKHYAVIETPLGDKYADKDLSKAGRIAYILLHDIFDLPSRLKCKFKFRSFEKKYLVLSKPPVDLTRYSHLISGSDQVWNPGVLREFDPMYFLGRASEQTVKISYAASLGNEIEACYHQLFAEYLKRFDFVSLREESSAGFVGRFTDKNVHCHLDPTMLLSAGEWSKIGVSPKCKEYILVYDLWRDDRVVETVNYVSKMLGLNVICYQDTDNYEQTVGSFRYAGPEEFIGLVRNAGFVISTSYHGVIFSILFRKKFLAVVDRKADSRIADLVSRLGLEQCIAPAVGELIKLDLNVSPDYAEAERILGLEKRKSLEYLQSALAHKNVNGCNDREHCTGCTACLHVCPSTAISMVADERGFLYSSIDETTCIKCGRCKKACPIQNSNVIRKGNYPVPEVFAVKHKSDDVRMHSSSGGAFTALSDCILGGGGVVYGAVFDAAWKVCHTRAVAKPERDRFRGSKYVQSEAGGIFEIVRDDLLKGNRVLFTGTPCQVAGLRSYLNREYENLYCCDLVCHGVSSPLLFREYLLLVERRTNAKIRDVRFRDKLTGWKKSSFAVTGDGFSMSSVIYDDPFCRLYFNRLTMRKSCYHCRFANFTRPSDITIGDFWGIEKCKPGFADDKGVSLVLVNSIKGKRLFDEIRQSVLWEQSNTVECLQPRLSKPAMPSPDTDNFWKDYAARGLEYVLNKYAACGAAYRLKLLREIFCHAFAKIRH